MFESLELKRQRKKQPGSGGKEGSLSQAPKKNAACVVGIYTHLYIYTQFYVHTYIVSK